MLANKPGIKLLKTCSTAVGNQEGDTGENKSQPLQSVLPKTFLDNISWWCFVDDSQAVGRS